MLVPGWMRSLTRDLHETEESVRARKLQKNEAGDGGFSRSQAAAVRQSRCVMASKALMGDLLVRILLCLYVYLRWFTLASEEEYRLLRDLRQNYDPLERPVSNSSQPLNVSMKLYLQQILDVDEKNQVVTLVAWIEYVWNDYKLRWDPQEYGNIKDIRIPGTADAIWKPDVLLYNSADENFDSTYPVNYIVNYNGDVMQVPPGIMKLSCKIDITWFPFDDQMCHLKFGSWTYSGNFIDLQISRSSETDDHTSMDIQYYVPNGEWNLLATPAFAERTEFGNEPYCAIFFFFIIQRRTLYYGLNLIIPSLLISLMTVLGFTLPPDAGEKITLEITILLSVCFFLSMVAEMTPPTSEAVPLIGAFFSCCMLVVSASVVFTVLVLNLHNRKPETHEMSPFLRKCLLNWLPWLLMMRRPGVTAFSCGTLKRLSDTLNGDMDLHVASMEASDSLSLIRSLKAGKPVQHLIEPDGRGVTATPISLSSTEQLLMGGSLPVNQSSNHVNEVSGLISDLHKGVQKACVELRDIAGHMKAMRKRMEEEERDEQAENDWKFAAMVVDRMCLLMFTIFIVASTCGIMFSSPHLIA
uniref:Neurotransmitter-gated ion-channel ligand-binding domain-containing protein n=1 Tax=Ascaris lumbricoides TaxID=6252 RepID=A0A9J2PCM7_ASCLU